MKRATIGLGLLALVAGCDAGPEAAASKVPEAAAAAPSACVDRFMENFKAIKQGPVRARYVFDLSKADDATIQSLMLEGLNGHSPTFIASTGPLAQINLDVTEAQAGRGVFVQAKDGALFVLEEPRAFPVSEMRSELAAKCALMGPGVELRTVTLSPVRSGAALSS